MPDTMSGLTTRIGFPHLVQALCPWLPHQQGLVPPQHPGGNHLASSLDTIWYPHQKRSKSQKFPLLLLCYLIWYSITCVLFNLSFTSTVYTDDMCDAWVDTCRNVHSFQKFSWCKKASCDTKTATALLSTEFKTCKAVVVAPDSSARRCWT